jgi:carbamoyl-phosphate synthase/aspartate carbamoyltransferase/dihydroorotase
VLLQNGFKLFGTHNTCDYYNNSPKIPGFVTELTHEDVLSRVANSGFDLVINIAERNKMRSGSGNHFGYTLRRTATNCGVSLITDIKQAKLLVSTLKQFPDFKIGLNADVDCFTNYRTIRLPGLIDVHVHTRDLGEAHKEDWESCSKSALAGGITMICSMPNTKPPLIDSDSFDLTYQAASSKSLCDFAFIGGAADNNHSSHAGLEKCVALKMYVKHMHSLV